MPLWSYRRTRVLMGWPDVLLEPQAEVDLNELLSLINFFGRSESWVRARVLSGITDVAWNCFPAADAPEGVEFEITRVACPTSLSTYNARPYETIPTRTGKRKKSETMQLPWLAALAWTIDDLLSSLRSDPPAFQRVPYGRSVHCFEVTPARRDVHHEMPSYGVLYALESKALPQVTSTLEIAERVRTTLMGIHKRIVGDPAHISAKFSGKEAGKPMVGHRHAYILPVDQDRDGWLDHLLIYCRESFNQSERLALDQLNSLWQPDGKPDIRCTLLIWGKTGELFKPAPKVSSVTPFVPPRHYRRGRGEFGDWLIEEVRRECSYHGLPHPIQVNFIPKLSGKSGRDFRWLEFRRNRQGDRAQIGYGFEMEFAQPVPGPIALGYGCHFGLGLFMPA
jgi:CRISPR-associated protein Csb2